MRGRRYFAKRIVIEPSARNAHNLELAPGRIGRTFKHRSDSVERFGIRIVGASRCLAYDVPGAMKRAMLSMCPSV